MALKALHHLASVCPPPPGLFCDCVPAPVAFFPKHSKGFPTMNFVFSVTSASPSSDWLFAFLQISDESHLV